MLSVSDTKPMPRSLRSSTVVISFSSDLVSRSTCQATFEKQATSDTEDPSTRSLASFRKPFRYPANPVGMSCKVDGSQVSPAVGCLKSPDTVLYIGY